ncbi:DinB family protein [Reichenbachiella carrageenanivorans]|uniref:DinB family protein n=1 Tax=Reichenbachiella carrageenanivorans TaxID=2979869 RepID=A0ABY6D261_9BACT|nr:DinB family protein [Reichenbachiella carrageenanivorans]UXX80004.1 DinB family protein [Reichenbachiella carrageenanivorans]
MKNIKNLLLTQALILCGLSAFAQQALTKEEKSTAINYLKQSQSELLIAVKDLSDAQLNYKPSDEVWSIAETMEHIAISEKNIFGIVEMTLKTDPDPSKRDEVSMSDEQLLAIITSRDQKVKTRPEFEPSNSFGSFQGSLDAFNAKRKSNIQFVKKTKEDLRDRYFDLPFGKADAYQVILFMSGHTQRHMKQIVELIKSEDFPQS